MVRSTVGDRHDGCSSRSKWLKYRLYFGTSKPLRVGASIPLLTKNLRAVLLLGYSKLESTVRYLGIEVDDALEISEQTEI